MNKIIKEILGRGQVRWPGLSDSLVSKKIFREFDACYL